MKEIKDFNTEKNIYIGKVLNHIHYKKLHTRIYEELSTHLDDMYEDFSQNCDDEEEITNKILIEMGNPTKLGIELKEANKRKLFIAKFLKITFAIMALPMMISTISLSMFIIDDTIAYFNSYNIEESEQFIIDEYNDGKSINHLITIDKGDTTFRYYISAKQKNEGYDLFHTESTSFLGINIKDRITAFGASNGNTSDNIIIISDNEHGYNDKYYYIIIGPTEEKYIKLYYEPKDYYDLSKSYWSEFIELPQNGNYEEPAIICIECPEGYIRSNSERFDENKEPID